MNNQVGKKYVLLDKPVRINGRTVYRIKAVRIFGDVKKGTLGGCVASENNLSHDDECWIYENGVVMEHAMVKDNARIYHGIVCESATVLNCATVGRTGDETTVISGWAVIRDNARVYGPSRVEEFAMVKDCASVSNHAVICGNAVMENHSSAFGSAIVMSNARFSDKAFCCEHAVVSGDAHCIDHCCVAAHTHLDNGTWEKVENRRYRLLPYDAKSVNGHKAYRVQALSGGVYHHDCQLGGYIESYKNLDMDSQHAWVEEGAYVFGDEVVSNMAHIKSPGHA